MKKPPQELIDAFLKWYQSDPHSKNEDYYREIIRKGSPIRVIQTRFHQLFLQVRSRRRAFAKWWTKIKQEVPTDGGNEL